MPIEDIFIFQIMINLKLQAESKKGLKQINKIN